MATRKQPARSSLLPIARSRHIGRHRAAVPGSQRIATCSSRYRAAGSANQQGTMSGASVDAPGDASISSNGSVHAVRCCRLSGLIKCGGSVAAGPVWRCADWVQFVCASLGALRSKSGFPDPVSLTFALTCPPTYPHPRRLPALRRSLRRWREPGRPPSSSSAPRRCAPSCWPAPPRRASSACAPASRPARDPSSRRAEPPSGPQSSRP